MYQLSEKQNSAILNMFLCTASVRPVPLPTDTSSLQFLLRSIAYCAQTSESTPRCTKIVEHSEYAVKHFQVIRDDLQNAIRKRDFSDVFNAGECCVVLCDWSLLLLISVCYGKGYLTDFDTWLKEYEPYGRSARMLSRKCEHIFCVDGPLFKFFGSMAISLGITVPDERA